MTILISVVKLLVIAFTLHQLEKMTSSEPITAMQIFGYVCSALTTAIGAYIFVTEIVLPLTEIAMPLLS